MQSLFFSAQSRKNRKIKIEQFLFFSIVIIISFMFGKVLW